MQSAASPAVPPCCQLQASTCLPCRRLLHFSSLSAHPHALGCCIMFRLLLHLGPLPRGPPEPAFLSPRHPPPSGQPPFSPPAPLLALRTATGAALLGCGIDCGADAPRCTLSIFLGGVSTLSRSPQE
ncbi:hypothetical protein LUU34_01576200 [Aix galericulata]|nr:hypothetical protein LUU34_01576200 [Aix galericulata]